MPHTQRRLYKRYQRQLRLHESLADDTLELPEDVVENTSTQQIIRGFIQELPKDQQKFLVAPILPR